MSERIQPLSNVVPHWDNPDLGGYPDTVRLAMGDGKVITYRIETQMPHPMVKKTIDLIRIMTSQDGYQPKHAKK